VLKSEDLLSRGTTQTPQELLGYDFFLLARHITQKSGNVLPLQVAFSADVDDFFLGGVCGVNTQQHTTILLDAIDDHPDQYRVLESLALRILHEHDQSHGSSYAKLWQSWLKKFVDIFLDLSRTTNQDHLHAELCECIEHLGRAEQLKSDSSRHLNNLVDSTLSTIETPLAYMLHKVNGEEPNTPQTELANEIVALAIFVRLRLGDLTLAQCESFCAARGRLLSMALDSSRHRQIFADSAITEPELWEHPPTDCLSLLRQYDADHSSKHAVALQTMLLDLSGVILAPNIDSERQLLTELQQLWEEVVTASRRAESCLNPASPVLIEEINSTVNLLLNPLSDEVKSHKEIARQVQTMDHWLRFELFWFACSIVNVDEKPRRSAIELLYDLAPTFGRHGEIGTIPDLRGLFNDGKIPKQSPKDKPDFLVLLESYDDYCGSDYANTAHQLLSKLATAIFSTNGPLSDCQTAWLSDFNKVERMTSAEQAQLH